MLKTIAVFIIIMSLGCTPEDRDDLCERLRVNYINTLIILNNEDTQEFAPHLIPEIMDLIKQQQNLHEEKCYMYGSLPPVTLPVDLTI